MLINRRYSSWSGLPAILFFLSVVASVSGNPLTDENPPESRVEVSAPPAKLSALQAKIADIPDAILRGALGEMLKDSLKHTPPATGQSRLDELFAIDHASQRVYASFMSYQATRPEASVQAARAVVKAVYDIALSRISWIGKSQEQPPASFKIHESIKDKYDRITFAAGSAKK